MLQIFDSGRPPEATSAQHKDGECRNWDVEDEGTRIYIFACGIIKTVVSEKAWPPRYYRFIKQMSLWLSSSA